MGGEALIHWWIFSAENSMGVKTTALDIFVWSKSMSFWQFPESSQIYRNHSADRVGLCGDAPILSSILDSIGHMRTGIMQHYDNLHKHAGTFIPDGVGDVRVPEHQHQQSIDPDQIHNQDYSGTMVPALIQGILYRDIHQLLSVKTVFNSLYSFVQNSPQTGFTYLIDGSKKGVSFHFEVMADNETDR